MYDGISQFFELLKAEKTRNVMMNNTYYEVSFMYGDELLDPLPERFCELSVQQVIKTSTNVSAGDTVSILYSKSIEKELNITAGDIIKVWLWQIEPERINREKINSSYNYTLYQPVGISGDILVEHVSVENSTPIQTTKKIRGFRAAILLAVMVLYTFKKIKKKKIYLN